MVLKDRFFLASIVNHSLQQLDLGYFKDMKRSGKGDQSLIKVVSWARIHKEWETGCKLVAFKWPSHLFGCRDTPGPINQFPFPFLVKLWADLTSSKVIALQVCKTSGWQSHFLSKAKTKAFLQMFLKMDKKKLGQKNFTHAQRWRYSAKQITKKSQTKAGTSRVWLFLISSITFNLISSLLGGKLARTRTRMVSNAQLSWVRMTESVTQARKKDKGKNKPQGNGLAPT